MRLKDKKGFTSKDFIIATLIFSATIALFVIMVGQGANDYDNTQIIDTAFSEKFDRFQNDTSQIEDMFNAVRNEGGLNLVGTADLIFFGTFKVIALIFNAIISFGGQIAGFGEYFGIPTTISAIILVLLLTVLTVYIIFSVINSVRSGREL